MAGHATSPVFRRFLWVTLRLAHLRGLLRNSRSPTGTASASSGYSPLKQGSQWFLLFLITAVFTAVILAEEDAYSDRFSKASCNFTLNLLKHVVTKHNSSNVIISPMSISILLSVLQQGAKENTLLQLENVLNLSAGDSRKAFEKLTALKGKKNVELEWGSRCYIKKGFEVDHSFQREVKNSFDVDFEELEILSPQESADEINKWVKKVTYDRITDLVDSSLLSPETIMLLINAIFFKGNWLRPFKKRKTAEDRFEITSESSIETLFMSQRGKFYADKDSSLGAKWVQLPFQNDRFAMVFILPTKKHQLSQLIDKLTSEDLHLMFGRGSISHVKMRIPKFKLLGKVSLVNTLQEMGLTDIFSGASDLRGIAANSENLQVSEIIHQAQVEIDEKGSTASAATVVTLLRMRTPNLSFVADQPFLFFIVDLESNIPLFAGKVINPKS